VCLSTNSGMRRDWTARCAGRLAWGGTYEVMVHMWRLGAGGSVHEPKKAVFRDLGGRRALREECMARMCASGWQKPVCRI